ncbi:MAG: hypothetical protein MMC23_004371 [Stictis urceolatum]|nr:hypothetical protein [Stictis urceolata]
MHSNREIQKIVYYCLQEEEKTLEGTGAPRAASKPLIKQIKAHALAHQAALEASTSQARKNWNNVQLRAYEALRVIRKVDFPVFGSSATFVNKIEVAIKLLLYVKRSWSNTCNDATNGLARGNDGIGYKLEYELGLHRSEPGAVFIYSSIDTELSDFVKMERLEFAKALASPRWKDPLDIAARALKLVIHKASDWKASSWTIPEDPVHLRTRKESKRREPRLLSFPVLMTQRIVGKALLSRGVDRTVHYHLENAEDLDFEFTTTDIESFSPIFKLTNALNRLFTLEEVVLDFPRSQLPTLAKIMAIEIRELWRDITSFNVRSATIYHRVVGTPSSPSSSSPSDDDKPRRASKNPGTPPHPTAADFSPITNHRSSSRFDRTAPTAYDVSEYPGPLFGGLGPVRPPPESPYTGWMSTFQATPSSTTA